MGAVQTEVIADTEISLRIPLPDSCPLADQSGRVLSANPHFVDGVCRCEFVLRTSDGGRPHLLMASKSLPGSSCLCKEIRSRGGIPVFDRVEDGGIILSLLFESRDEACSLYRAIQEYAPDVEILSIASGQSVNGYENSRKVDMGSLTEKQAEALTLAVCQGYYETPREVGIASLAEECDISRQAFSHRLRLAEAKVLGQLCLGERREETPLTDTE